MFALRGRGSYDVYVKWTPQKAFYKTPHWCLIQKMVYQAPFSIVPQKNSTP